MVISIRRLRKQLLFLLLFMILTFLLYQFIHTISAWISPLPHSGKPEGDAVKVLEQQVTGRPDSLLDRLFTFYEFGE